MPATQGTGRLASSPVVALILDKNQGPAGSSSGGGNQLHK